MLTTEAVEVTLEAGNAQATIRPYFGGRITSFRFDGREHLADGLILATDPYRGGCHPLAPWAGTLPDAGILREENATFDVPPRPNGQRKHGYVDGLPWEITRVERARVELRCDVVNAGLWNGQAHQSIELEHDRLRVTLGYTAGAGAPIALGLHPWFLREPDGSIPRMTFAAKRRIVRDRFGNVPLSGGVSRHRAGSAVLIMPR